MIKSAALQTTFIDDISLACRDIKSQLDTKLGLLENTVGIVQCDPEFIERGIMPLLSEVLGFPLVGGTTISIATNDEIGNFIFSLLVITSDDVSFVTGYTRGLAEDFNGALENSLSGAISASGGSPSLAFVFPTVTDNDNLPGDNYVEAFEAVCGKIPVFGTLSVNDSLLVFDRSMSVHDGKSFKRDLSYLLFFGDVNPRFFTATVPRHYNIIAEDAVATKVKDNLICEINNVAAYEYFESLGLAADGQLSKGVYFVPLLVKYKFGSRRPFVRALVGFNEDGHAILRGKIPENTLLGFGSLLGNDILEATSKTTTQMAAEENVNAAIVFSCIIRRLNIGADDLKELAVVRDALKDKTPLLASYSGGEIAPIGFDEKGDVQNAFHNYSLIACLI